MSAQQPHSPATRTISVPGRSEHPTVLFTSAAATSNPVSHVLLFFEGDAIVEDGLREDLGGELLDPQSHLRTMQAKAGPNAWVGVVQASRVTQEGYACYENFLVECTATGEPIRYDGKGFKASSHLAELLEAASEGQQLLGLPCRLVAFSKSGVVLNQLLTEMADLEASTSGTEPLEQLTSEAGQGPQAASSGTCPGPARAALESIKSVHYLDCGLAGRGVHLTDPQATEGLGVQARRRPLAVHFHGTPRQWADARRPWIKQEKDRSAALLRAAGVPVTEHAYFEQDSKRRGCGEGLRQHFASIGAVDLD